MRKRRTSKKHLARKNQKSQLKKKLIGYSAAASAALVGGQAAEAATSGKINQNIMILPGQTFDLDLNNDGTPDLRLGLNKTSFSTTDGFNVGGTSTNVNSAGTMATVKFYNYFRSYRNTTNRGNAYASNIGFGGQIATSGYARKLQSSTNVDAGLFTGGSSNAALGFLSSSYRINVNTSSVRYYKQLLSTGGGVTASYTHPTLNSRFGGYSTGPTSFFTSYGQFPGMRGFLGVQFDDVNSDSRFAWVDVELEGDYSKLTIHGWAFETQPGVAIHAGSVPEPSGLALLATGAAGLLATRRSRRQKHEEQSN